MSQDCHNYLARLSNKSDIAKHIDFDAFIQNFAKKEAPKAILL